MNSFSYKRWSREYFKVPIKSTTLAVRPVDRSLSTLTETG